MAAAFAAALAFGRRTAILLSTRQKSVFLVRAHGFSAAARRALLVRVGFRVAVAMRFVLSVRLAIALRSLKISTPAIASTAARAHALLNWTCSPTGRGSGRLFPRKPLSRGVANTAGLARLPHVLDQMI